MIPKRRALELFVFLTLAPLTACEPLAPQQTPQIIIVTGVTEPAPLHGDEDVIAAAANSDVGGDGLAIPAVGVVNTPLPTSTPTPIPTPLPTATPFGCRESSGRVIEDSVYSAITGGDVPFVMYLPPCFYESWRRYPYVILLHGTGYDERMWLDLGVVETMDKGIKSGVLPPMVLVMPDGDVLSELNNQPVAQSYEGFLLNELIPALERFETGYCLWSARDGRAIGGISRGGFWAFSIALRHPDLFAAVGGHSPFFDPDNAVAETNPLDLATQAGLSKSAPRIWIDSAADDYVITMVERMAQTLQARDVAHEVIIHPTGGHEETYWKAHLAEYLAFYGRDWPLDSAELPSCEDAVVG